ncbi:MAG: PqqD family protein [Acidobacteria bacterium]|nr:PqqD family protein [Acidobacteriota bacterium]
MERIRRAEGLAWRNVGGETVIVHLSRKQMYGLNVTAGRVWNALATPAEFEDLERLLLSEAGVGETPRSHLAAFLKDLAGEGLIEFEGRLPTDPNTTESAAAPRIEWREEIRQFAGTCALQPGVSDLCNTNPQNS